MYLEYRKNKKCVLNTKIRNIKDSLFEIKNFVYYKQIREENF